jgi:hypothetical protein
VKQGGFLSPFLYLLVEAQATALGGKQEYIVSHLIFEEP